MAEFEGGGVKEVSSQFGVAFSIGGIGDYGVANSSHVDPDLVGPTGVGCDMQQGITMVGGGGFVAGLGVPASLHYCHFLTSGEVPSDWGLDDTLGWGNRTLHECEVGLGYGAFLELSEEVSVSRLGFSDKEKAGRVFVEAVNYAGSGRFSNSHESGEVREEGIGEGIALVGRAGMGGEACRFVDGQQVVIFVDYVQGEGLGGGRDRGLGAKVKLQPVGLFQPVARFGDLAVDSDPALGDQLLDSGAGEVGMEGREMLVQPFVGHYMSGFGVTGVSHLWLCPWSPG